MMRILFFTFFDYPHVGGMSTHMDMLIKGIEDKGEVTNVLSFSDIKRWLYRILVALPYKILKTLSVEIATEWVLRIKEIILTIKLGEHLRHNSYSIINCQDVMSAKIALKFSNKHKFKVVLTAHGYFVLQTVSDGQLINGSKTSSRYMKIEQSVYESVDKIITVDNRIKDYINGLSKSRKNVTVIQNFVDIEKFIIDDVERNSLRIKWGVDPTKFVVFCPRRMVPKNGVIYPAIAMKELSHLEDVLLVYAGSGQEKENIVKIVKENGLFDKVLMLGDVKYSDIPELYSLSDAVIIPSINSEGVEEATSISAIEGMASKKVVIASSIGGLKELIINNNNGILIEEKQPSQIAKAIEYVMENQEMRLQLEENARKTVESIFNLSNKVEEYINVFKNEVN